MSESFAIRDLGRRKFQTSVAIVSIMICVASTVSLTILSEQLGSSIVPSAQGKPTSGFTTILSQYIFLVVVLIFIVGAVTVSFLSYLMMSTKIRDIGLMKGAGCPNYLLLGYFIRELLIIALTGCVFGTAIGILAGSLSTNIIGGLGLTATQTQLNLEAIGIIFALYLALSLILGAIPIHQALSAEPAKAISPAFHAGVDKEQGFNVISKRAIMLRIGFRSLVRRRKVSIRTILCSTTVFMLVTVAVAGGIIANSTTGSWVERAVSQDTFLVANQNVANRYDLLLKFSQNGIIPPFNYTDSKYAVPQELIDQLKQMPSITVDPRLILEMHVKEVQNFSFDSDTLETIPIGDGRQGQTLIIGIDPQKVTNDWFMQGRLFEKNNSLEAMIGDSLAANMFSVPLNQSLELNNTILNLRGVCTDPINKGNVTYVPLSTLQKLSGITRPNLLMIKIDTATNRTAVLNQLQTTVNSIPDFTLLDLNTVINDDQNYLGHLWLTAMLPALASLAITGLCLVSYVMLGTSEQHQEFGVLRALGVRPKSIINVMSWQVATVLVASYVFGVAFGIIITLLILVPEPVITQYNVLQIVASLLAALLISFAISLYPAIRFARKSILDILSNP
jgi:ABC-type antimicrobial peptide transport system permease subunit